MDKALILAQAVTSLKKRVDELSSTVVLQGKDGEQGVKGEKGDKGDKGERGLAGSAGYNGKDGKDGKDGVDGKDGKTGVSIKDAYFAADNSLILVLSNGKEIDVGQLDLLNGSDKGSNSFTVLKQTQDTAELIAAVVGKSFETVSKNLSASSATLNYTSGILTSIVYANGITKTFTYSSGILTTITLSGTTPSGISLNKNLNYTSGTLSSISYS